MKKWLTYASAVVASFILLAFQTHAAPSSRMDRESLQPEVFQLLLEVHINGKPAAGLTAYREQANDCALIETAALKAANIYQGTEGEICLQSQPGLEYVLDRSASRLNIYTPETHAKSRPQKEKQEYATSLAGLIGGYSLSVQRLDDGRQDYITGFGDLSLGLHSGWGRVQNDVVASWGQDERKLRRMQTVYEYDYPDRLSRLSIGDVFTRSPRWGRVLPYAGVQIGTDLSMDPDQSWRPYRTFQALLREQSEVDVRVNGVVRRRESLSPGYRDVGLTPETGLNEVEIAIRDASGLTRIEDFSFFHSATALGEGVTDYSVGLGLPRRFNGLGSDYEDAVMASGFVRHGISNGITAEAYGEFSGDVRLVGGGAQLTAGRMGILHLSAALSESEGGSWGHMVSAGLERSTRKATLALQARLANEDYADMASVRGVGFPDLSVRASLGMFTPVGSFRTAYTEESDTYIKDRRFVSFEWDKPFANERFSFSAQAFHDFERESSGLSLSLRASLGGYTARASRESVGSDEATIVQLSRIREQGDRLQWAVQAAQNGGNDVLHADALANLESADIFMNAGAFGSVNQVAAGVRGGFVAVPGRASLQRQGNGAAALVHVPGLSDVPLYKDNLIASHTNKSGVALISGLRPFEVNYLSLRPEDLPMEVGVGSFEVQFVPKRGVSEVRFDIQRDQSLGFTVLLANEMQLPEGNRVRVVETEAACLVGLEGRVYCASAEAGTTIEITTPGGKFTFSAEALRQNGLVRLPDEGRLQMARNKAR